MQGFRLHRRGNGSHSAHLKKVLALVMAFAMALTMMAGAAFTDSADIEATDAVDTLSALGVINGYEDGSFKPNGTVTRAEMAAMIYIVRNDGKTDASGYENLPTSFTDIKGHWAEGYIKHAQTMGIISGRNDKTFDPNAKVTGVEAALMCLRTAGYDAAKAGIGGATWANKTLSLANEAGLLDDVKTDLASACPRQWAAQLIYNLLDTDTVVFSKDSETFESTDRGGEKYGTVGNKYMNLQTYEGILQASGKATPITGVTAAKDKLVVKYDKIDNEDVTEATATLKYTKDVNELLGQRVKVLYSTDKKEVYGVSAVTDENTVVTAAFTDVKKLSSGSKVKVNDTEYKYDSAAVIYGVKKNSNDMKISALHTDTVASADQITFISNDGDETFDLAIINPIKGYGKVTYVGADSFTVNNSVGSKDFDDVVAYEGLAKDDYVVMTKNFFEDKDEFAKMDSVTAKITSVKGNPVTDVKVDDTWYKLAVKEDTNLFDDAAVRNNKDVTLNGKYTLKSFNGIVYYVDEEQSGSTDTAYVISATDNLDTNGNYQAKLLFADGSTKVVGTDKDYSALATNLVTYEISEDAYELKVVSDSNLAGGDDYAYASSGFVKDTKKVDGKRVADSATIFVKYVDGSKTKQKVITGKELNSMSSDFGTKSYYIVDDGLITVALIKSAAYLPGASSSKTYGYITSDIVENKVDGVSYKSYTVWTTAGESIDVMQKSSVAVAKGDLVSFDLAADNYVEGVKSESATDSNKLEVITGALKDFSVGDWATRVQKSSNNSANNAQNTKLIDKEMHDDVEYLFLNTADKEGVKGDSGNITKADEPTEDTFNVNTKFVMDEGKIRVLVQDVDKNQWDGAGQVTLSK